VFANPDFPNRIKVLWDAGADFPTSRDQNNYGTAVDTILASAAGKLFSYRDDDMTAAHTW